MDAFLDILNNFGFPIACVVVLAVFCWKMINEVMTQQKAREEKLYSEIEQCRVINQTALETIASYSDKLENIQADVKEMKTDITVIKAKIE